MGGFGGRRVIVPHSSRKPEYSPILTPGGRSDRCQRHRGLNGQPTVEADTFGLEPKCAGVPPIDRGTRIHRHLEGENVPGVTRATASADRGVG
jgi:hypothetical protein